MLRTLCTQHNACPTPYSVATKPPISKLNRAPYEFMTVASHLAGSLCRQIPLHASSFAGTSHSRRRPKELQVICQIQQRSLCFCTTLRTPRNYTQQANHLVHHTTVAGHAQVLPAPLSAAPAPQQQGNRGHVRTCLSACSFQFSHAASAAAAAQTQLTDRL